MAMRAFACMDMVLCMFMCVFSVGVILCQWFLFMCTVMFPFMIMLMFMVMFMFMLLVMCAFLSMFRF